ncbi:MAG: glycosyltransferase family 4 protein [Myxococcota bacterium]
MDAIYDKPDLVIANHFLHVAHGATLAATLREVPTVVVSHGTDMEYACAASAVARGMARETLARTTKPVALNETARRRLCELLDAPAERFAVVPVGIDTDVFRSFDEPRAPRVVQVGRLLLDKGPHLTIAAFAHLLHDGLDAELELIGDGPDRTSLQALVQAIDTGDRESARRLLVRMADTTDRSRLLAPVAHSLFGDKGADVLRALEGRFASRVRFAGYLAPAEVAARLRRARVCVLPSMVPECYPLTLIEAMASGCLIQASPLGGTAEILAAYEREAWMMDPERPIFSLVSGIPRALRRWNANLAMDLSDRVRGRHEWRGIAPSLCRNERTPSELPPPMRASVWS